MYDGPEHAFIASKERTNEGFFPVNAGIPQAIARGLAYAPYADLIWCETGTPDLHEAKEFAEGIHRKFPGKLLAYNCSPSFNWKKKLDDATIAKFQRELGAMPLLRGATIIGTRESEPDELRVVIDARGRALHSTFVIADRDVRQRLIEILKPGLLLDECLSQSL